MEKSHSFHLWSLFRGNNSSWFPSFINKSVCPLLSASTSPGSDSLTKLLSLKDLSTLWYFCTDLLLSSIKYYHWKGNYGRFVRFFPKIFYYIFIQLQLSAFSRPPSTPPQPVPPPSPTSALRFVSFYLFFPLSHFAVAHLQGLAQITYLFYYKVFY